MKTIKVQDATYKTLNDDAKRKKLSVEELIEVIIRREYKIK